MLRYYGSPCSLRLLSENMGISMNILLKKMERMMEAVRTNSSFERRCNMLYVYE